MTVNRVAPSWSLSWSPSGRQPTETDGTTANGKAHRTDVMAPDGTYAQFS
jgi:hypothetical protein